MEQVIQQKRCSKCKQDKSIAQFYKDKSTRDGFQYRCKSCKAAYQKANPERTRQYNLRWQEKNPGKYEESTRKYREANRDRAREAFLSRIGSRDPNLPWPDGPCSYSAAHVRVKYTFGYASGHSCVDCGQAAEHWSYNHAADVELSQTVSSGFGRNIDVVYSADPHDYDPRCQPCHRRFDFPDA